MGWGENEAVSLGEADFPLETIRPMNRAPPQSFWDLRQANGLKTPQAATGQKTAGLFRGRRGVTGAGFHGDGIPQAITLRRQRPPFATVSATVVHFSPPDSAVIPAKAGIQVVVPS